MISRCLQAATLLCALILGASAASAQAPMIPGLTPPTANGPVEVEAAFRLLNINDIDDETETVEFSCILTLTWHDPRQAFDPVEAGIGEKVFTGNFQFDELSPSWFPQVILTNASGLYESRAVVFKVKPDGTCQTSEAIDAIAKVDLDLRRYPFDTQKMNAVFEVLGFGSDEVVLTTKPGSSIAGDTMLRVPQWHFNSVDAMIRTPDTTPEFIVTIEVSRKSLFMIRLVVFPLILIVMLSWSVFWMDRSSLGDRMSVSFVGILTAVAYQIVLSDTLPKISYVTVMNAFLNGSLMLMCSTIVLNLIVRASDKRGDNARGHLIDMRCRWMYPVAYLCLMGVIGVIAVLFL